MKNGYIEIEVLTTRATLKYGFEIRVYLFYISGIGWVMFGSV